MEFFQLRFQCTGRFSELDSSNQDANRLLMVDLLSQVMPMHQSLVIIERLDLFFIRAENLYLLSIDFWLDLDEEESEVQFEMLVGKMLLQLFSEIAVVDDLNM